MKNYFFTYRLLSFFFVLLFVSVKSYGQNSTTKSIKLYTNFSFVTNNDISTFDSITKNRTTEKSKKYQLGYFSPAFTIERENGNFHEFELARLLINFNQNETIISNDSLGRKELVAGEKNTRVFFALRYEYNIVLRKTTEKIKLTPYLGLSINPFFENSITMPSISSQFPERNTDFGALFAIVPRINYTLKGNWYLDLNVPIQLFETHVAVNTRENPILPISQRKTTLVSFEALPRNVMVRFGVGLRI